MTETIEQTGNTVAQPKDQLIKYLESLVKQKDRAALANLRRGLGKPPKTAMEMYPYLGQFLSNDPKYNYENAIFIVAALFAYYPDAKNTSGNIGASLRRYFEETKSDSVEKRFVALLNAESDELPNYLRQIVGLLKSKEIAVNWEQLLKDVQFWNSDNSRTREKWARSFWGTSAGGNNQPNQDKQNTLGGENQ